MKDLVADAVFRWSTWTWAKFQSAKGKGKAYVYYFDHPTERAKHAAEIGYVFRRPPRASIFRRSIKPEDQKLSDLMSSYWLNFAKTGDPNGPGLPEWQPFSAANQQVMYLDASPRMQPVPKLERLEALDAYFAWRREQAKLAQ
jgi:para-nitrobenzyl esterase